MTGPIIFANETARGQLEEEGEVVTFRRSERTTGKTWYRYSRTGPKQGDVLVEKLRVVDPRNPFDLDPSVHLRDSKTSPPGRARSKKRTEKSRTWASFTGSNFSRGTHDSGVPGPALRHSGRRNPVLRRLGGRTRLVRRGEARLREDGRPSERDADRRGAPRSDGVTRSVANLHNLIVKRPYQTWVKIAYSERRRTGLSTGR